MWEWYWIVLTVLGVAALIIGFFAAVIMSAGESNNSYMDYDSRGNE